MGFQTHATLSRTTVLRMVENPKQCVNDSIGIVDPSTQGSHEPVYWYACEQPLRKLQGAGVKALNPLQFRDRM